MVRRSEEGIRQYYLKKTPIGTSKADVLASLKAQKLQPRNQGEHVKVYLGGYWSGFLLTTGVELDYAFSTNGTLDEIDVEKTTDGP